MAIRSPAERAAWAKLVVDLDELARVEWATLEFYAAVRGIETRDSARRNLFRTKASLARRGIELAVVEKGERISARFATPEIADLVASDLRAARELVERLDARREGREPEVEAVGVETEVLSPETVSLEYRGRAKSFAWIARKHGVGKDRIRRILVSTGPIRAPGVRRRVEDRRAPAVVARALEAADRGAPLDEIAESLACPRRTASRFLRRHGRRLPRGPHPGGA